VTEFLSTHRRERLKRNLDELPDLMALVDTSADTLLPRRGQQGGSRPTPGSRPPVNLTVVDLRDERAKRNGRLLDPLGSAELEGWALRQQPKSDKAPKWSIANLERLNVDGKGRREGVLQCLGGWVRLASEEMDEGGAEHTEPAAPLDVFVVDSRGDCWLGSVGGPTVVSEAGWLSMHLGWIVQQQWVTELEQDVRRIHRDLQTVVGEGRPEYRPRCPNCKGRMDDEGAYFTCRDCGHQVRDQAMDHRTALANESPMDAYGFGAFGITPERIWQWVQRGHLNPATDDEGQVLKRGKRHLYHPLDVLRLADAKG